MMSGKSASHSNTIDCILDVTIECEALQKRSYETWDQAKIVPSEEFNIYILCEYKPKLEEISAYLGQIHVYIKRLKERYGDHFNKPTIIPVLITLDDMNDFDSLFTEDGIRIFRLAWDANTNTVVNLPEAGTAT